MPEIAGCNTGNFRLLCRVMRSNPTALRATRERAGHTMRSLSRASGISHMRIGQLESGAAPIRPTTAKALADALGVDLAVITISDTPAEVAS